ncbi:MAG: HAD family hydrolase [Anaerolineae bacterium]|nr:HAD family hydrolase [Anaerolineae bacterium]
MQTLIWDFDGTLGYRDGGAWTASLLEVLDREWPGHTITYEQLSPYTWEGFPWQRWEIPHTHLTTAEAWWGALAPLLEHAYISVGIETARAQVLVTHFRNVYLNLDRWRSFDDVYPTLDALLTRGWQHVILSNHVPELRNIVQHLGLTPYFSHIFNSAETGYEKPHPRAFEMVLEKLNGYNRNGPVASVGRWMIGDSFRADVQGAESVGLPAILVRRSNPGARYYCEALDEIVSLVDGM